MKKQTITLASPTLHMNSQIFTLFSALSTKNVDVPEIMYITTRPYCNCREQGFVLTVDTYGPNLPRNINYAFYEHRNSDSICVIKWEGRINITGGVTPSDIPEEVFRTKYDVTKSFDYMDIRGAVCWFMAEIENLIIQINQTLEAQEATIQ